VKYTRSADGAVEILMGPAVTARSTKKEGADPRAFKRSHYMNLLGRASMTDAELDMLPDAV
jgi:hypothetical protein